MLVTNSKPGTVKARLKIDMVVAGEARSVGDVVELTSREFRYLEGFDRVEAAPAGKK